MQDLKAIIKEINRAEKPVIITHNKPDGDAMGSMLALYHLLTNEGKAVAAISPSDFGEYLQWLPGTDKVINFYNHSKLALEKLNDADLIICLDFNNPGRVYDLAKPLVNAHAKKVVIDHHTDPDPFYDYILYDTSVCATAELLYGVITEMSGADAITPVIATCLYTGIITDSGSFRYPNVTGETHKIAAHLLEKQIDHSNIHRSLFDNNSVNKLRFLGHCLCNKMEVIPECRTAYIYISYNELQEYGIGTGDTEGLVNYPLSLDGIVFGALIIERADMVKMSFRSVGEFPVNEFAKKYFEGGGHVNAAGGKSNLSLEETVKRFTEKVYEVKDPLIQD